MNFSFMQYRIKLSNKIQLTAEVETVGGSIDRERGYVDWVEAEEVSLIGY